MEEPEDQITVSIDEHGDFFEGTRDMFRDCFFDNAYDNVIIDWCQEMAIREKHIVILEIKEQKWVFSYEY